MEKAIIEQYRDIIKETQDLEHRVRKLKGKLDQMERTSVKDKVRGGAGGHDVFTIEGINNREYSDRKTKIYREMYESYMRLQDHIDRKYAMLAEVETYIAAVPDAERRLIMRYHYQDGYSWSKTARMLGEGYTADAVRISIKRFLSEEEKKCG